MKEKCYGDQQPFDLGYEQTDMLAAEAKRTRLESNSWLISICFSSCLCRRERGMRLQEKAIGQFESHLDIRSIVKTRIDLSILIRSLLNKEQRVLFRN